MVSSRLLNHTSKSNLKETFQSGFKAGYSTETALLNVTEEEDLVTKDKHLFLFF